MPHSTRGELDRRKFIQHASLATGIGLATSLSTLAKIEAISIISDPYPIQYYFELRNNRKQAWLYPGFALDLASQPYFVSRHA